MQRLLQSVRYVISLSIILTNYGKIIVAMDSYFSYLANLLLKIAV